MNYHNITKEDMIKINIWEIRTIKGLSLSELSDLSGVSKTHLNDIENGKKSPTLNILEKIALALNVNIYDLYSIKK